MIGTPNSPAARATHRRLKVFQAQFGFYDSVVAAPSQAAALRAWGTRQNLFASGQAKVTTDQETVAVAKVHPETPLRRAIGSSDPFALEPTGLPKVPPLPKKVKPSVKLKPAAPAEPAPDRSKLDAAEKALRQLNGRRKVVEAEFRREQEETEERRQAAQDTDIEARRAATTQVLKARTAYRNAGGND